jgi:hypothetical protein
MVLQAVGNLEGTYDREPFKEFILAGGPGSVLLSSEVTFKMSDNDIMYVEDESF